MISTSGVVLLHRCGYHVCLALGWLGYRTWTINSNSSTCLVQVTATAVASLLPIVQHTAYTTERGGQLASGLKTQDP